MYYNEICFELKRELDKKLNNQYQLLNLNMKIDSILLKNYVWI